MTDPATQICEELGVCREEAIFYLEGFDWNLEAAMEACRSKTLNFPSLTVESPPEKEKASPEATSSLPLTKGSQSRNELIAQFCSFAVGSDIQDANSYLERNDWDLQRAVSQFFEERRPTPSQRKLNRKLGRMSAKPPLVSSHLKVQERSSLVQDKEEKLSAVKGSAEGTSSSMSASQLTNKPEEKLCQWKEERIESFFKVATGASREAAIACLSHSKWNKEDAISYFFGDYAEDIQESTSPVKESAEALSSSMSLMQLKNSPEEEKIVKFRDVVIVASRKAAEACLSHCKWNHEDAVSYFLGEYIQANPEIARSQAVVEEKFSKKSAWGTPSSMSSGQLTITPEQKLCQWKEEGIKSFRKAAIGASREAAVACLSHCKWNQDDAISYFFGDYTEDTPGTGKAVDEDSSTEPLEEATSHVKNLPEQPSQWKDDLIDLLDRAGDGVVTRDIATIYLTHSNWDVKKAFSSLLEEDNTTQVQASHGSQHKGYLEEDETESSSSSSNTDPTETGNVTVAVPEDASSQVDENVEDKDVEEELSPVPVTSTTVELKINLAVGESWTPVWIFFRSDQTVRDIRKRIDWFRPEDKRAYYLKSDTGVEYRDLDTTVHKITSGSRGSTTLYQMCST